MTAETAPSGVAAHCVALTKRYGHGHTAVTALDAVDVAFAQGQFTAIMGPSGSGKSTLMHCMAGLDSVTSGSVFIGDIALNGLDDRRLTRLRRDRIGFIFQAYNLVPTLTALENITLPMDIAGRPVDQAWLDAVVDTLGLRDRLRHQPTELSGGQQQRVACARALAGRPAIIFADEPTGNLDSRTGAEVLSFLRESVRRTGQTIAMVTHDPSAAAYADRVLFLADGRIVDEMADPTADRVLERLKAFEADVPHPEVIWAQAPAVSPVPEAPLAPAVPMPIAPPTPTPPSENGQGPDSAAASPGVPDPRDMVNWTDADWDAWLQRKPAESGPGA